MAEYLMILNVVCRLRVSHIPIVDIIIAELIHAFHDTLGVFTVCEKKYFLLSLIHPGFSNFNVWSPVPVTFESFVNSSLMAILVTVCSQLQ